VKDTGWVGFGGDGSVEWRVINDYLHVRSVTDKWLTLDNVKEALRISETMVDIAKTNNELFSHWHNQTYDRNVASFSVLVIDSSPQSQMQQASRLAEELAYSLGELAELTKNDDRNQLNAGLHMMSVYEKLMMSLESGMHPAYRRNIEEFRKTIPVLEDK
jgi:hypothetical protein